MAVSWSEFRRASRRRDRHDDDDDVDVAVSCCPSSSSLSSSMMPIICCNCGLRGNTLPFASFSLPTANVSSRTAKQQTTTQQRKYATPELYFLKGHLLCFHIVVAPSLFYFKAAESSKLQAGIWHHNILWCRDEEVVLAASSSFSVQYLRGRLSTSSSASPLSSKRWCTFIST